jgi:hypothetical protein
MYMKTNRQHGIYYSFDSSLPPTPSLQSRLPPSPATPKLLKVVMTRSEAAVGSAASETKGDAVRATIAAGLHSSLGAAGGETPTASTDRVDFKVSPSRFNVFLVVDSSRD